MAFEKHARTVTLLTLLSRFSGLARDKVQSHVFGASPMMSAFAFGFQIPNLFRRLFGEGALTASFVPVYARLDRTDTQLARRFAGTLLTLLATLLTTLTAIGMVGSLLLPARDETAATGFRMLTIMLPYMPMVCVVALLGSVLGVHGRFGPAAFSPILLNLGIMGGAMLVAKVPCQDEGVCRDARIMWVAIAVVVAGVAQLAWMGWSMRGQGIRPVLALAACRAPLLETFRSMLPMLLGLGVFQLNVLMDSLIACYPLYIDDTVLGHPFPLDTSANAIMNWATRLYEFPLGVFGISVATVLFPLLARQASEPAQFMHSLRRGVRLSVFIGVPASLGLVLVGRPMSSVVYLGGRCTPEQVAQIASVLIAYAPAVVAYSVMQLLTRAFYALGDQRTPTRLSMAMVALNLALNVSLIWTPLGITGLAWSTTICSFIQWALLARLLRRRMGRFMDDVIWRSMGKTAVAAAVMGMVIQALNSALPFDDAWWGCLWRLLALTAAGGGAFFLVAWRLRMPEWRWALGMTEADARVTDQTP